jgi:uncharacterized protein DUF1553/uncharacterized protein DUF1549
MRSLLIALLAICGISSAAEPTHWAYVAPQPSPPPAVLDAAWPKNAIDAYILQRLQRERIPPSPPADRERLIRRLSLDLTGLPPNLTEADSFLSDHSPDSMERLIDRLLASPRYGERWATPWLDAARYADSNGYQRDGHRTIWPFRDWIIRALNGDMPFDQFTIEQIAGDLLPPNLDQQATLDQQVATGFHRCTTVNVEAGTDEEENRINQVIDRVNVTGTVWLGTTLECCQCHDHKYDPFTQRDYYRLFAFFNQTPKETYQRTKGSAALDAGGPDVALPLDPAAVKKREETAAQVKQAEADLQHCLDDETTGLAAWETAMADAAKADATKSEDAKLPANIRKLLAIKKEKRNKNQLAQIRTAFIGANPEAKRLQTSLDALRKDLEASAPPASPVMSEMTERRTTSILDRGDFLSPTDKVEPGTPEELPPMPEGAPPTRLGLARWLVNSANPLTARVQVNRAWSQIFGRGIVASEEDFGIQADEPTHPQVLDWLAMEFVRSGWSMKTVHRRIVESATYQQESKYRTDLATRDPNNLLLARGARIRLEAELVRDNALAASGQLSSKMLGPPVYPPQPDGLWRVTGQVDNTYRTSTGDDGHRRGVYTVRRRSAPYPSFINFDAPDRSACTVKRPQTSTPLQALTLQNDPVYVELAKSLADRVIADSASASPEERLIYAFRTVLIRRPSAAELATLRAAYDTALQRYEGEPQAADSLVKGLASPAGDINIGAKLHKLTASLRHNPKTPTALSTAEWSAWFNIAHILLNLDETITKN